MSSSADSNFLETMQEAPFAALGMMEGVEPPESIKNMLSLQRTMVNVLNSAIMSALRFGMVLAGLLLPGFLLALLPNGAPAVLNKMLVWANTITLLGIFASLAAAALTIAGSVGIYLLLKFRQATQVHADPWFRLVVLCGSSLNTPAYEQVLEWCLSMSGHPMHHSIVMRTPLTMRKCASSLGWKLLHASLMRTLHLTGSGLCGA
eukprot:8719851-Pyramimonas_sp.AAC.1